MSEGILINPNLMVYFATITVTYPSGSTLTCSNGSYVLTAETTSGSYTFVVPYAGTWTVKATQGSNTASANVSVTAYNQAASATLSYELVLFNGGSTVSWTSSRTGGDSYVSIGTTLVVGGNANGGMVDNMSYVCTASAYDLTKYSSLVVTATQVIGNRGRIAIRTTSGRACDALGRAVSDTVANVGITANTAGTYTLDINNYTGNHYISIGCGYYGECKVVASKVVLK